MALTLEALGHPCSKVAVYNAVQVAGAKVPGLRRDAVRLPAGQALVAALGADLTSVRCKGEWLAEVAAAVGADLLVTDDADGFKTAADATGLAHQVCKAHVVRNTDAWVERMEPALADAADGSLARLGADPVQAVKDVQTLRRLMHERDPTPEAARDLRALHRRYQGAPPPAKGEAASLAYRLRLFSLDRWNLWARLTRYRTWTTTDGGRLDGTNNATERAIGW